MKDVEVKKQVAKSVGLPQYTYLESWMRSLTVLRNCCAHHARAWNRRYPAMPQLPNITGSFLHKLHIWRQI